MAASGGILIFEAGDGVEVSHNAVDANDVGIWVIGAHHATVEHNEATNSTFDGIALDNQNIFTAGLTTEQNIVRHNDAKGNGEGIGLFSANSNLIEKNHAIGNAGSGFVASYECDFQVGPPCTVLQPSSSGNLFDGNHASDNGAFGFFDDSSGGGTSGTANTYVRNRCKGNISGSSSPNGLCK